ncbi:MAG: hypothetical protein WCC37_09710, partial [Candidatus Sulfotelmatobacter sp.]
LATTRLSSSCHHPQKHLIKIRLVILSEAKDPCNLPTPPQCTVTATAASTTVKERRFSAAS